MRIKALPLQTVVTIQLMGIVTNFMLKLLYYYILRRNLQHKNRFMSLK